MTALGSALIFAFLINLRQAGLLEGVELAAYDAFIRHHTEEGTDVPIAIIRVTEQEIQELRQWPLTDAMLAKLLLNLVDYEPRVIGVDIYRDLPVPPGAEELESVLLQHDEIIVVEKAPNASRIGVPAPNILRNSARVGFNDIVPDPAGVVRRALLFMDYGPTTSYAFALRLALRYLEKEGIFPQPGNPNPAHLRLGSATLPPLEADHGGYANIDARGYQIMLGYNGGPQPFSFYSLKDLRSGQIKKTSLRDKIVLLGVISESVKDILYTPYNTQFVQEGISGILFHAHVANQLLLAGRQGIAPRRSLNEISEVLWIFSWCMLGGLFGLIVRTGKFIAGLAAVGLITLTGFTFVMFVAGWWIPLVPPAFGLIASSVITVAYLYGQERWERNMLMRVFSKNLSPEVAQTIWQQRTQILEGGRICSNQLTATVLFSDIQGYTAISEELDPQPLLDWLNEYMDSMTQLVMQYGGVVDDYSGDGIKANFGVPFERATNAEIRQDALNAVRCALSMQTELAKLNAYWQQNGLPAVNMRVGINTGTVVAGTLGSADRIKYTTVGDTVNVAARLEGLKVCPEMMDVPADPLCRILVSEETFHVLGVGVQAKRLGTFTIKGREQPVDVYIIKNESAACSSTPNEEEQLCVSPVSH